jgi:hypothetical protein
MPAEASTLVDMINTLGMNVVVLLCCFWWIKYQADQFSARERLWIDKDGENDRALRELMTTSNTQLLQVLSNVNSTLKEMTVAISRLESKLEK